MVWKKCVGLVIAVGDLRVGSILGSGLFFCVEAGYCISVGLRWIRRSAVGRIWTVGFEIGLIWLKDRFVCKADKDTSGMR